MKPPTATETLVEEREELMVLKKSNLFKPCSTSEALLPNQNRPDLKALSFTVSFHGWRKANKKFQSWVTKMSALHKPIWVKAGIFEAVMASTYRIERDTDLVLGIAEKWSPGTNTFVFPWGETSITLEDVMVLLEFSVLGLPGFASLDSSGEEIRSKLEKKWVTVKEDKGQFVTQVAWMRKFMNRNDDLEHVAFLACWLSYFVFPIHCYHIYEAVLPIAVHLSIGTKIALAPAVLAHLYADLSLLKNHIQAFAVTESIDLTALFKLVQVWTWERFKEIRPEPNPLLKGEPRLALWDKKKLSIVDDVRQILDNSKIDSFEWRPFTKPLKGWEFPRFYPEKALLLPAGSSLDDEFISFARFIKVSELVGIDKLEHYFPDRVASQFGMLQDAPSIVNWNKLSQEEAWDHYNKPIDSTLYIPSRSEVPCVTPAFCEWWRKRSQEIQSSSETRQVVDLTETSETGNIISNDVRWKSKALRNKRCKYMNQAREKNESTMEHSQTLVPSDSDEDDDSLSIAQRTRQKKKKYSDGDASEQLGKKSRTEADNNDSGPCTKLASISEEGDEAVPPPDQTEEMNEEIDELSPINETNSLDPSLGTNGVDIVVSPAETDLGVYGRNADMMSDNREEPKFLRQEKESSNEKLCIDAGREDNVVDGESSIEKQTNV